MRLLRDAGVVVLIALTCLGAVIAHDRRSPAKPLLHAATDFTAFYCAGTVVRAGGDPYRVEPLRACEQRLGSERDRPPWSMTPVPFPGYVLAAFVALSLLPFWTAHALWIFIILLAVGATAWALARISGFPFLLLALVLMPALGLYDIGFGEPTPITAALLALAAERAHARSWRACGVLLVLATIEPHLVLPAFIGVLLFVKPARVPLLAGAAALAALSLAVLGLAQNVEYVAQALPAQAASEIHAAAQFSVPHELALLGVRDGVAFAIGWLSYAAFAALGVVAARRLERVTGEPACLVLIPPAVTLIGGNFAHDNQVLTALGAAILLASQRAVPEPLRALPVIVLSIVWVSGGAWPGLLLVNAFGALAAIVVGLRYASGSLARRAGFGIAIAFALAVAFAAIGRVPTRPGLTAAQLAAPAPAEIGPADDAGLLWRRLNDAVLSAAPDPRFETEKIPMELGLLAILAAAFAARGAARRDGAGPAGYTEPEGRSGRPTALLL